MVRLFVRAQRAWLTVPAYVKVAAALCALLALVALNVGTALAAADGEPFRWK